MKPRTETNSTGDFQHAEYYDVSQTLYYDYKPTCLVSIPIKSSLSRDCLFSVCESGLVTAKPVLDHQDWNRSNIIIHPNGDRVAGIIDWKYAAFVPDPEDYFLRGVSMERRLTEDWWSLFKGVKNTYADVPTTR